MAEKSYPIQGRLLHDGKLYDPEDAATPKTIVLDEEDAEPLVESGVLGAGKAVKADKPA